MKNVKMKWVVAVCAVGLLWSAASVASAISLSAAAYNELQPMTSTDVTTLSFDYTVGSDGYVNNARSIRVYGYYDGDVPGGTNESSQWMMPCKFQNFYANAPSGGTGDWLQVDTDYGPYWGRLGDLGTLNTVHQFEFKLNRHNGLFEVRFDGTKVDFLNSPGNTNNPQPDGDAYYEDPFAVAQPSPDTFFADEEIDPDTLEYVGIQNAKDMLWWWDNEATCPCWEYGVGGAGEYYLIFDQQSMGEVTNIRPGIMGDANLDGTVDAGDASVLGANWLGTGKTFVQGDFNLDGNVDDKDAGILVANWGNTASLPHPDDPAEGAVPEPSTWCLLAGALALLAPRRRTR